MIIGTILLLISGFFLFFTTFLTGATVALPLMIPVLASVLAAFYTIATLSIVFLYGTETGSEFVKCLYGINIGNIAGKASFDYIRKLLESSIANVLSSIVNGVLMVKGILDFGKCVNSVVYGH